MRTIKGILIDPFACTVTEVEHDADDYTDIYRLLSHESMKVGTFEVVHLDDGDAIFVDEEGLLKPCDRYFVWSGYHQPLAGKGLILGSDIDGDSASCKIQLAEVRKHVLFAGIIPSTGNLLITKTPWRAPAETEQ